MSTLTGHQGAATPLSTLQGWGERHMLAVSAALIAAAVVCGVLVGVLFTTFDGGFGQATVHRGGGTHARAAAAGATGLATATVRPAAAADATAGFRVTTLPRHPAHGGAHGRATQYVRARAAEAAAAAAARATSTGAIASEAASRSHARSGFAVGRTAGAGSWSGVSSAAY